MKEQIERLQVYGQRCSGTTRFRNLCAENFPDVTVLPTNPEGTNNFGWKHGPIGSEMIIFVDNDLVKLNPMENHYIRNVDDNPEQGSYTIPVNDSRYAGVDRGDPFIKSHAIPPISSDLIIVVNRDPFSWLQSLYALPYHALQLFDLRDLGELTFDRFLEEPWITYASTPRIDDQSHKGERRRWIDKGVIIEKEATVFDHRAASIGLFESFPDQVPNVVFVNHEAVNRNPEDCIDSISQVYGIRRTPMFTDVTTYKGRSDTGTFKPKNYPTMRREDLTRVIREIDWVEEGRIGYKLGEVPTNITDIYQSQLLAAKGDLQPLRFYKNGEVVDFLRN